jgi:hypothetical protein
VDPVFEMARSSPQARRGLATRKALYRRVTLTRRLLRAWDRSGKFLSRPGRRLTRQVEATDLARQLKVIAETLEDFPPFLGQPGQPGQHVATIARQRSLVDTFKKLDLHQREALAKDWLAGRMLLSYHSQFLRQRMRSVRKMGRLGRLYRAVEATLNDHPGYVFLGLAFFALVGTLIWVSAVVDH